MEAPQNLISTITPKSGKKITAFDKHSKYIVKITTPVNLAETLHRYSEDFFEAAHLITEFILDMEYSDMSNTMQLYFPQNKRFDFLHVGDFFEELNNILDGIDSQLSYIKEIKAEMEAEYQAEMMAEEYYC